MSGNTQKEATGHEHLPELMVWKQKCGHLGNEIGKLRMERAELKTEIDRLRQRIENPETVLKMEHQTTLDSTAKCVDAKCGRMIDEIDITKQILAIDQHQTKQNYEWQRLRQQFIDNEMYLKRQYNVSLSSMCNMRQEMIQSRNELATCRSEK